ncbi:MAG: polysaccharide biosynthesis/export family protein [Acidobacteriota bacterium]|nr:MAG: polysaccharide biosynthesis/export family protein [Acidobacteriota bacterium]
MKLRHNPFSDLPSIHISTLRLILIINTCLLPGLVPVRAQEAPPLAAASPSEEDSYRVGPGDLLEVRVFGHPELGREARISNQGTIRLPFLDEIQVACQTENQISKLIVEKFRKYLRDPQIDVFVKEYKSQPVSVIGSVATPGRFQLQRRVRLLELLTFSGGPNLNSGGVVHIIRGSAPDFCELRESGRTQVAGIVPQTPPVAAATSEGGKPVHNDPLIQAAQDQGVLISYNIKDVLLGLPESNPFIRPGDIISVPETDQVFVTGFVVKPGPISVRTQVTLMQALGMAGGFMPDAARNRVRVVRQDPATKIREEFILNVDQIRQKKAEDIVLQPNDVIDVPASIPKNVGRGLIAVAVGMVGYLPFMIFR